MEERFWSKVDAVGPCWLWTAGTFAQGYGSYWDSGLKRMVNAHRWSWLHLVGPIPRGLVLDHLCRVKLCVCPDHLEPVTQAENIRRGYSPQAMNGRLTTCRRRGHPFDARWKDGGRRCNACRREMRAARKAA